MKTAKLIVDYDYEFDIIALISSAKDYKLAWVINNSLKIHLCKEEDLSFEFLNDSKLLISNFLFEKEYSCFWLLRNRSFDFINASKPYLIPELKEYDYFIKIDGEKGFFDVNEIIKNLQALPEIQYVKKIDIKTLKSKENLIF